MDRGVAGRVEAVVRVDVFVGGEIGIAGRIEVKVRDNTAADHVDRIVVSNLEAAGIRVQRQHSGVVLDWLDASDGDGRHLPRAGVDRPNEVLGDLFGNAHLDVVVIAGVGAGRGWPADADRAAATSVE